MQTTKIKKKLKFENKFRELNKMLFNEITAVSAVFWHSAK